MELLRIYLPGRAEPMTVSDDGEITGAPDGTAICDYSSAVVKAAIYRYLQRLEKAGLIASWEGASQALAEKSLSG